MANPNFDNNNLRRSGQPHFYKRKMNKAAVSDEEPHHPYAWTLMVVLLIAAIIGLAFGYRAYLQAQHTFSGTYQKDGGKQRNVSQLLKERRPFSILLMGTDTGALGRHDVGRTDSIIVASVNPETQTTYLTSIPRDTKVVVPGDSQPYEKINAAYTIGGPKTAIKTVSNLLNVPIDYFALVNMGGMEKMVKAVGGVEVKSPLTFKYQAANVQKGKTMKLDGKQALDYSRMRDDDPLGDYGRQIRQRQVLQKLVIQGMNIASLPRYQQILQSLNGNLKTDMNFDDMMEVRAKYGPATHHIHSQTLQGNNATINGISFQVAPSQELLKVSNNIRSALGLPKAKSLTPAQQQTNSNDGDNSQDQTGQSQGDAGDGQSQNNNQSSMQSLSPF